MEGELKRVAQAALKTRPNFAYTLEEVKADVRRVFNTGWFKECNPDAVDTRDGVKLIITVGRRLARGYMRIVRRDVHVTRCTWPGTWTWTHVAR